MDIIFIRFGTNLYRQIIGIPMGTNCAPFVADLFLICYEGDFMKSLSPENQADIIECKKISNDQELIQSDPISCPQNQKGNN